MYICICNPFSDRDVRDFLDQTDNKVTLKTAYRACSGGEDMNCGSCACELKRMVDHHNNAITIGEISANLSKEKQIA